MGEGWPGRETVAETLHALACDQALANVDAQHREYHYAQADAVLALYAEAQRRGEEETRWANRENELRKETGQIIAAMRDGLATATARGWELGRDAAALKAHEWADSKPCTHHDDNPCCHVRTGAGIAAAIRAMERA